MPLYGNCQCKSNMQSRWQIKFTLAIAIRSTDLESNHNTVMVSSIRPRREKKYQTSTAVSYCARARDNLLTAGVI